MTRSRGLYLAVALSAATVFVADLSLALGIAVWVLYFVPIALSKFAKRPQLPLLVAFVCSILIAAGFFLKGGRDDASALFAPINRAFAVITFWIAAFIGRRFILIRLEAQRQAWLTTAQAELATHLEGDQTHAELGDGILAYLAHYLGAHVGAFYVVDHDGACRRSGSFALDPSAASPARLLPGEGLVGQVARDNRLLHLREVPARYLDVSSSLGAHAPAQLVVAPVYADGVVHAVIELGFLTPLPPDRLELFPSIAPSIAAVIRSATFRARQQELLEETQRQAEELQTQHEELRVQNEELEQQSHAIQDSQRRLETHQVELQQSNAQLEERTQSLSRQRDHLARARKELERANIYKSEFLANMSHELRTPLNSSLILAKLLVDNRDGNLNEEQIKFAQTIYSAGNDLLTLINDILDLSKIEAGKLDVRAEEVVLSRLLDELSSTFHPIAADKSLNLSFDLSDGLPSSLVTDPTRLQQILRNLLSNALKFTDHGGVSLVIRPDAEGRVAFEVRDTGIGIDSDEHESIFEAFRQADGTIHRKYGGTGLGLSISRDLARLLGGDLSVDSAPGRGSTFTLVLPPRIESSTASAAPPAPRPSAAPSPAPAAASRHSSPAPLGPPFPDDRQLLGPGDRTILVIEDDVAFARILHDLAHEMDFKVLVAQTASEGLAAAEQYRPSAIVLDVGLPDRSGLSVLDVLKHNPATRHLPVHVISASDHAQTALQMGAAGYAIKPVKREQLVDALRHLESKFTQKLRRVLVVEDDDVHRDATCRLLAHDDVQTVAVGTAAEALERLGKSTFDCMVLDLNLPDRSGLELLEDMAARDQSSFPPVIVYTGRTLSRDDEQQLRRFSQSIIIKGARSPERLLDEVTLFLHQVESDLPPERQRMLRDARHREAVFEGRRVLVVEDDVRNIFALSSVLEPKGITVEIARNGREALEHLRDRPGVDLVLMDIMMPEMDGLEATREIRKQPSLAKLPIIALTAKAMADDRDRCLTAGANDYIAKPLDVDKLLSLARVWMPK